MSEDREKLSDGPNDRPVNETIAGTGPGIADDALSPGVDLADGPTDEDVARAAQKLGVQLPKENGNG
jgi:hypothetical protein